MIHTGDCVEVMAGMEAASVDAICTDPPYGLEFMGKAWDKLGGARIRRPSQRDRKPGAAHNATTSLVTRNQPDAYVAGPRMQRWHEQWAREAFRVAKPSAYLLAFGGTRTVHRLACAIEDAGWIIRDMLVWGYASGFPKSKACLKPAWEPIVMARKPGPLRELAIDACRIGLNGEVVARDFSRQAQTPGIANPQNGRRIEEGVWENTAGRWPANLILTDPIFDGGVPGVVGGGESASGGNINGRPVTGYSKGWADERWFDGYQDEGTYSRYFLIPKADRADREPILGGLPQTTLVQTVALGEMEYATYPDGTRREAHPRARANHHPTVKPVDLMRHLVRLVTPTGGIVLDPFLGSGTTAIAAEMEGFEWIGIEREPEYVEIAEARLNGTQRGLGLDIA